MDVLCSELSGLEEEDTNFVSIDQVWGDTEFLFFFSSFELWSLNRPCLQSRSPTLASLRSGPCVWFGFSFPLYPTTSFHWTMFQVFDLGISVPILYGKDGVNPPHQSVNSSPLLSFPPCFNSLIELNGWKPTRSQYSIH